MRRAMMLPREAVYEFIKIYKQNTGKILCFKDAVIIAQRFFGGMSTLLNFKDIVVNQENK